MESQETLRKVLLVDDSRLVLRIGALFLEHEYAVVTAESGREALELAARERPDLILMDVNMPELNGFEAAERLARDARTRAIPVVLVTTECERGNGLAGWDHLSKPFDAPALRNKVREYLAAAA